MRGKNSIANDRHGQIILDEESDHQDDLLQPNKKRNAFYDFGRETRQKRDQREFEYKHEKVGR